MERRKAEPVGVPLLTALSHFAILLGTTLFPVAVADPADLAASDFDSFEGSEGY